MRITGGEWASRRIAGPSPRSPVRPTPDALREQAFAVLAPMLECASFLDLFAGSGVNSLEALSRGAGSAMLVEVAASAATLIRRNFAALGVSRQRWTLEVGRAEQIVRRLGGRGVRCKVAWCDPPFAEWELGPAALAAAAAASTLVDGAFVVLERPPKRNVSIPGFITVRELRGAVLLRRGT
jgi:16S rRNA (guanine966-N2)-methyltransferase